MGIELRGFGTLIRKPGGVAKQLKFAIAGGRKVQKKGTAHQFTFEDSRGGGQASGEARKRRRLQEMEQRRSEASAQDIDPAAAGGLEDDWPDPAA